VLLVLLLLVVLVLVLVLLLCRRWLGVHTRGGLKMIFPFIRPRVRCPALRLLLLLLLLPLLLLLLEEGG